jgi:predicted transcriptional regulator
MNTFKPQYDRGRILRRLQRRPVTGMTCDEVEQALGLLHQTASARLNDLMNSGDTVPSGVIRKTRNGVAARVYSATRPLPRIGRPRRVK